MLTSDFELRRSMVEEFEDQNPFSITKERVLFIISVWKNQKVAS